ncbi:MAG: glycosyltransferase family 2 protein [Planctomycetes bacterium]|nr:glycosyltransferase family 2 protein [Planctomycetota bacterium]
MDADPDASAAGNAGLGPVSVVVVNWNGAAYLEACLSAVRALSGQVGEVILVDNASTDDSLALVRERFPEVRVLALPVNAGPCPARNAGMRAARQRYVLALDNDAVVRPDVLEKLARAAAADASIAIAQPRSVFAAEPSRVHYDGGAFHYAGLIALRNFYAPLERARGAGTLDVDCAVAVALLVDRDRLLGLGGYDESMFILFEDLDLSYRLRACGARIVSVEDALVDHQGGTPGLSFREGPSYPGSRVFQHSRNRWTFLAKCYRRRTLLVALPGIALYEAAWLAFAVLQGHAGDWWRGKRAFLRDGARRRADRARFQAARVVPDRELLVGGPLTITPALKASGARALCDALLSAALRAWWALARHLAA